MAAGKYNDGSPDVRGLLAQRMSDAMRRAWEGTVKSPVTSADVQWRVVPVALPMATHLDANALRGTLEKPDASDGDRLAAASNLAWLERCLSGQKIPLSCLRIGPAALVQMPGELFVEYQLAAQKLRPELAVCVAAYGDYGPGYIGTQVAYGQGGYETSPGASRVAPEVESVLLTALEELLKS